MTKRKKEKKLKNWTIEKLEYWKIEYREKIDDFVKIELLEKLQKLRNSNKSKVKIVSKL